MRYYYVSGIIVVNTVFTVTLIIDKRYSLAESHFLLWSKFCVPFTRFINSYNIPISDINAVS